MGRTMSMLVDMEIDIENILVTAIEGGSNYWADFTEDRDTKISKYFNNPEIEHSDCFSVAFVSAILNGETLTIKDSEFPEDTQGTINTKKVTEGIVKLSKEHKQVFSRIIEGDYDAGDADVALQFMVLGQETYG